MIRSFKHKGLREFLESNKNWRITFVFADGHASAVNFEDYH